VGQSELAASYAFCQSLHREHGRSYYLATRLLPRWKRRHVHALYGFTRYTDDLLDAGDRGEQGTDDRADRLDVWTARFYAALAGDLRGDRVLPAIVHTIATFDLDLRDIESFLASMRMDLKVTQYADYQDLLVYMEGSAAVIGTLMLPILLAGRTGSTDPAGLARSREPARELGLAFQLTNFIRDVAEDFALGRVYLPQADLARFGVTSQDLGRGSSSPQVRRLVAFEIERAREHYRKASQGLVDLPPRSRRCIHLALVVYSEILTQIEAAGYEILGGRITVPQHRRLAATVRELSWSR
jgi:phytoene synthase